MASPLIVSIPHQLTQTEAKARVDKMMSEMSTAVPGMTGFAQEWDGDTLSFETTVMGQKIAGTAGVTAQHVNLNILLPGMLGMMAGKIKSSLEQRGQILLGPPKA